MEQVLVHERVVTRHPEVTEADVQHAWRNAFVLLERVGSPQVTLIALGADDNGRVLEMVGTRTIGGSILINHALTPPTRAFLHEIGLR